MLTQVDTNRNKIVEEIDQKYAMVCLAPLCRGLVGKDSEDVESFKSKTSLTQMRTGPTTVCIPSLAVLAKNTKAKPVAP